MSETPCYATATAICTTTRVSEQVGHSKHVVLLRSEEGSRPRGGAKRESGKAEIWRSGVSAADAPSNLTGVYPD